MTTTPTERKRILAELSRLAGRDLSEVWRRADVLDSTSFRSFIVEAFPELVAPYAAAAADLSATWYEDADPSAPYVAQTAEIAEAERLQQSAQWALNTTTGTDAIALMIGTMQRAIFDGARDTTLLNAESEPRARWARHASANACGFCRMLATRHVGPNATFYSSSQSAGDVRARGNQKLGGKYHDNCHCIAVEVRPGQTWEPPDYVEQWNRDYIKATRQMSGSLDPNAIARAMATT